MRILPTLFLTVFAAFCSGWPSKTAYGDIVLSFSSSDFGITSTFNNVALFQFDIVIEGSVATPGAVFNNPNVKSIDYRVDGVLSSPTPSNFPAFRLIRSMDGAEFYGLSPDAELSFSISNTADLSDGLQISELAGAGEVFRLNLREFNQNPGRYHPPIFTLNDDGTGRLVNANNQSTFPNPPPPTGSGGIVDVAIAEEYDVALTFDPNLTMAVNAVPEPSSASLLLLATGIGILRRRRR